MKIFEILIYAIVALAMVLLLFTLITQYLPKNDNRLLIKTGLTDALIKGNIGKTINLGALSYEKGFILSKNDFDQTKMLIALECTSPQECCPKGTGVDNKNCNKNIIWDEINASIRNGGKINTFVRCTTAKSLPICKIYLSAMPAQAQIEKLELVTEDVQNGTTAIRASVKNSGQQTLTNATATITLEKKNGTEWVETDYYEEPKSILLMMPGEKQSIIFLPNPATMGEYRAKILFEGQNAGFDINTINFSKNNTACNTLDKTQTIFDPTTQKYQELYPCSGCISPIDCAIEWGKKNPAVQYFPYDNQTAYCLKSTEEGNC
ncbi:MAG: hypothetical protein NTY48_03555 [Candidatus Diapherotrites archaeon]|nr:hypothetical protein [Candidatus Diapherotrites archaeon]